MKEHPVRAIVSVLCLTLIAAAFPALAQPRLDLGVSGPMNFGTIYRGAVYERTVEFKNSGADTLVITNVEASCGCTGAMVSSNRIPPGGSGSLKIQFNSTNFTGVVHKTVTLVSNVPDAPRTLVEFTATIVDEIVLTPPSLWYKEAETGKPATLSITVRNGGADTLYLKGFRTTLETFTMNLPSGPIAPGGSFVLEATFTPKQPSAIVADRLFVETSNPRRADLAVPIYGNVKPAPGK
jgi:hypothetical protein